MKQAYATFPGELTVLSPKMSESFFQKFCPKPQVMYDLGDVYADLNAKFFDGELPVLAVVSEVDSNGENRNYYPRLKWDGRLGRRVLGMYHPYPQAGTGLIRLATKLAADPVAMESTLLHEMLHKWLDLKGMADGVKGHGPNFILHAHRLNLLAESLGKECRVHYRGDTVDQDEPTVEAELFDKEVLFGKDLDMAHRMKAIARAAFDTNFTYKQ
jgi:hypothetical protein